MKNIIIGIVSFSSYLLVACGAGDGAQSANDAGNVRQTLRASGKCDFKACGEVPKSMNAASSVSCAANGAQACAWSPSDAAVSYRHCADEECPDGKPEIGCPSDNVRTQQCGSANGGACLWTTVCTPPRVTTACADAHGCDALPVLEIGVICQDGSTGGFACVTDNGSCFWERNCD